MGTGKQKWSQTIVDFRAKRAAPDFPVPLGAGRDQSGRRRLSPALHAQASLSSCSNQSLHLYKSWTAEASGCILSPRDQRP